MTDLATATRAQVIERVASTRPDEEQPLARNLLGIVTSTVLGEDDGQAMRPDDHQAVIEALLGACEALGVDVEQVSR